MRLLGGAAVVAALALACAQGPAPAPEGTGPGGVERRDGRYAMGTLLEITLLGDAAATLEEALEACFALAAELEARFTTYDDGSELMGLNARAGGEPVVVSPPLRSILADARGFAEETGGSFDVTVGPLIRLWTRAAELDALPSPEALTAVRARIGASRIALRPDGRVWLPSGASVDLGGLAKGWALDRMAAQLAERGITRGVLSFGGSSVLALGAPRDAPAWRVLVRSEQGRVAGLVSLRNRHLSVSESLGRSSEIAGRRFGHVIDPRSGWPVEEGRLAAVVTTSGARAEALSTALLVVAPDAGLAWADAETHLLLLDEAGRRRASPDFERATGFVAAEAGPR